MNVKGKRTGGKSAATGGAGSELRRQAEEVAASAAASPPPEALSPDEAGRLLHELQVHQIELQMQNEELRRIQLTLDTERARYFDLYELAPAGYLLLDDQGVIRQANLKAAALLGVDRRALVQRPLFRFILREDQDIYYLHRKQLDESGGEQSCELRMVRPDGTQIWVKLLTSATPAAEGSEATVRVIATGIDERKQAEQALRESEDRYRALVEWSPVAIGVHRDGKLLYLNPAAATMLGAKSQQKLLGKPIFDFVHPGDHSLVHARRTAYLDRGLATPTTELRFLKWDGTPIDMEIQSVTINFDGKPATYSALRDITERKVIAARMQRVAQLYAALSLCNQAIVRCSSETELFPQICRDVVQFGGMRTAWIAVLDEAGQVIRPVAVFGVGADAPQDLAITVSGDEPLGRGPTGTAIRDNQPVWCQDFQTDPSNAPWHARGMRDGWAATASLPLHRFGEVIGAFTLCAGDVNFFDDEVRTLLQAMAFDISFALDSYAREAARLAAEQALRDSEAFNAAILNSVVAEIAVLDADGVIIAVNEPWQRFARENGREPGVPAPNTGVGANYFAVCQACNGVEAPDAATAREGIRAVMAGRRAWFRMEYACHSPDRQRWFTLSVTKFGGLAGGAVVAHGDITESKQSQLALDHANQRFRDLVDSTDGIVWEADANTFNFKFVSGNAERILGYPAADWLQPGFWAEHIHPDDRERAVGYCATRTGQLDDHEFEYRFMARDGRVVWLGDLVKVVSENGKARWLRGLMVDITARKAAETRMRVQSRAMDQSPASIVITDSDGRIEYVNPAFERITGYTRAEVLGQNPRILQSGKTPAAVYQQMWGAIAAGSEWRGELCNRRKNGELFWEFVAISGIRSDAGGIERYIAVKEDITARKQAEADRAKSEERHRNIIQTAMDGFWLVDADGRLLEVNEAYCRMSGYREDELLGMHIIELDVAQTTASIAAREQRLIAHGRERFETRHRRKDGTLFDVAVSVQRTPGGNGIHEAFLADISARKAAEAARADFEAQLRESQKLQAIGTLAGGIAHDFNNILATILGNAELAREDIPGTSPLALDSLHEIRKAAERASALVQQILAFSRRQPLTRVPTDLTTVIDESVRLLRPLLPARIALNTHCGKNLPLVLADGKLIQQVLINLATNAMQAIEGAPGQIEIRLESLTADAGLRAAHASTAKISLIKPGPTVRITVRDSGMGMDAATLGRIFEPFFTTKPVGEGTGLGLSVAQNIVQGHDGAIAIESQPGQGSTFTVYLPALAPQTATPVSVAVAEVLPAAGKRGKTGGERLLYIDDDESLLYLVERLLTRRDLQIRGFTDPREALDALRADPAAFDLVVTDYNMPGLSGLDVAREVRTIRADLPVAVASGFIDETLRAQAGEAGVREVIFKANAVEDLCDAFVRLARSMARE